MIMQELPELTALFPKLKAILRKILTDHCDVVEKPMAGEIEIPEDIGYSLLLLDLSLLDLASTCPLICPQIASAELLNPAQPFPCQRPMLLLAAQDFYGTVTAADRLVVKILQGEEVNAILPSLLRSLNATPAPLLQWGELQLNPTTYSVMYQSTPIDLTPKEYGILELLMGREQQIYSCKNILENLWDAQEAPTEEAVRTHIKCLRRKLKAAGAPADCVETVYGFGYRLKPFSS